MSGRCKKLGGLVRAAAAACGLVQAAAILPAVAEQGTQEKVVETEGFSFIGRGTGLKMVETGGFSFVGRGTSLKMVETGGFSFVGQGTGLKMVETGGFSFVGQAAGLAFVPEAAQASQRGRGQAAETKSARLQAPRLGTRTGALIGKLSALKVASIRVSGRAVAGQPVNLMVTLKNTSDKPIEANLKGLKIACVAPAGATCTIQKTRAFMGLTLQPGQTRTLKFAVQPSTGGRYKVSIAPHNASASSGRNISLAVAQAPISGRNPQVVPKLRVAPKSPLKRQ